MGAGTDERLAAGAITVRYYAGARAAAGVGEELAAAGSSNELRAALSRGRSERFASVLACSTLMCDGVALSDGDLVAPGSVVEVLPPFAGG